MPNYSQEKQQQNSVDRSLKLVQAEILSTRKLITYDGVPADVVIAQKKVIREFCDNYCEAWKRITSDDAASFMAQYTPNARHYDPAGSEPRSGCEDIKKWFVAKAGKAQLIDFHVVEMYYFQKPDGSIDMHNFAAKKKVVTPFAPEGFHVINKYVVDDNFKIVEVEVFFDTFAMQVCVSTAKNSTLRKHDIYGEKFDRLVVELPNLQSFVQHDLVGDALIQPLLVNPEVRDSFYSLDTNVVMVVLKQGSNEDNTLTQTMGRYIVGQRV